MLNVDIPFSFMIYLPAIEGSREDCSEYIAKKDDTHLKMLIRSTAESHVAVSFIVRGIHESIPFLL